jgi:hypothetical protein
MFRLKAFAGVRENDIVALQALQRLRSTTADPRTEPTGLVRPAAVDIIPPTFLELIQDLLEGDGKLSTKDRTSDVRSIDWNRHSDRLYDRKVVDHTAVCQTRQYKPNLYCTS